MKKSTIREHNFKKEGIQADKLTLNAPIATKSYAEMFKKSL